MKYIIITILAFIILFWPSKRASAGVTINMGVIKQIESSGRVDAVNESSGAVGWFQITKICLSDYNQYHKVKYAQKDLFDGGVNTKIAEWYMNRRIPQLLAHYGYEDSVYNRLVAYNAGIYYVGRNVIPTETMQYVVRYKKEAQK